MKRLHGFFGLLLLFHVLAPARTSACAAAPHAGQIVRIASEEALIVWDAATHTEHFIRRGAFDTDASDFGFLVPTPSPPELGEADDAVFDRLAATIQPRTITEHEYVPTTCILLPLMTFWGARSAPLTAAVPVASVRVISEQRVAGLDATVIAANDAAALTSWLDERGYPVRPELTRWLEPYVAAGYAITAFKIARGDGGDRGAIGTRAVRMTFHADAPYYPYREPEDTQPQLGRLLRLFVASGERVVGQLDHAGELGAATLLSSAIEDPGTLLAGVLPNGAPMPGHLTVIDDTHALRSAADLFFAPSQDTADVEPPPIVHTDAVPIPIPIEIILPAGLWWYLRRRKRAR